MGHVRQLWLPAVTSAQGQGPRKRKINVTDRTLSARWAWSSNTPTLYGIPIPRERSRSRCGRSSVGQRRLMYRGPVERDGVFITEDVIADHVTER